MNQIFGILMGAWVIGVGAYSFYYAFMMKQTGTIRAGWIVSRQLQLKESRDMPGFIQAVEKKTKIFGTIAVAGGALFIAGQLAGLVDLMLICMLVLIAAYIWYSSTVRKAELQYLAAPMKKRQRKSRKSKKNQ